MNHWRPYPSYADTIVFSHSFLPYIFPLHIKEADTLGAKLSQRIGSSASQNETVESPTCQMESLLPVDVEMSHVQPQGDALPLQSTSEDEIDS